MSETRPVRRRSATPAITLSDDLPELDLNEIRQEGAAALIARGSAYVREYATIEHKPTILLHNIATVLVALRQLHTTEDTRVDWRGRSGPYRRDAAEIYRLSGVTDETMERVSRAVRWHVGNILRDHMTPEELEDYELRPDSPLERLQDDRASRAAIVAAARAESTAATVSVPTVKATADHIRLGSAVTRILDQLSIDVITDGMTDGQRAKLDTELAAAQEHLRRLRRYTRKRSSEA